MDNPELLGGGITDPIVFDEAMRAWPVRAHACRWPGLWWRWTEC